MRKFLIALFILIIVMFSILLLFRIPDKKDQRIIKFGLTGIPDILDIPYYIALDKGFFKDEGLNVEFVNIAAQGDVTTVQATISGEFHFGSSGFFSVLSAINEGASISAIVSIQNSHDYSLVTNNLIKSISQLKNKTIAIFAPGDITQIVTHALLDKYKISPNDVTWLSVGGSESRYRALLTGKVDAAPLHADYTHLILNEGNFHILSPISKEQPAPMSVVYAKKQFLNEHPEIAEKFVLALIKATRFSKQNKFDFIEIAKNHLELNSAEIANIYDVLIEQDIFAVNGGLTQEAIKNAIDLFKISTLSNTIPSIERIVESRFINLSLEKLDRK